MQEPPIRDDGLQLEEVQGFHRTFWIIERCAWGVYALILALALAGLTGAGGYVATSTASVATGELEYPRVSRWMLSDQIKVSLRAGQSTRQLTLGPELIDAFELESVLPEPEHTRATRAGTTLEFVAEPGEQLEVVLSVRPRKPGAKRYVVSLDAVSVEVRTIILP